jgi:hypothetical protein
MNEDIAKPIGSRRFEDALLCGEARAYAVCAKPRRFGRLPDTVATTFAEIGEVGCFYVFESEAEANRRMAQIPPEDRLGWLFSVREVSCLSSIGKNDGPKLDICGYPFAMRGYVVDAAGAVTEWCHPGKLGWRGPIGEDPAAISEPPTRSLIRRMVSWLRQRLGKRAPDEAPPKTQADGPL